MHIQGDWRGHVQETACAHSARPAEEAKAREVPEVVYARGDLRWGARDARAHFPAERAARDVLVARDLPRAQRAGPVVPVEEERLRAVRPVRAQPEADERCWLPGRGRGVYCGIGGAPEGVVPREEGRAVVKP